MATNHTCTRTQHATLSTTTIDSVTITGPIVRFSVWNDAAVADGADIWITYSQNGVAPADPVAEADNTYRIPPQERRSFYARRGVIVKLLGSGNAYDVEGHDAGIAD